MRKIIVLLGVGMTMLGVHASWYWPFGSDDAETAEETEAPRLSVIMEPASTLIDEASDLAAEGKLREAIEKYREVLQELDRIERDNPERVKTPEFATVRNKRAYVNAAIDSMLLAMAQANAKSVAVSDTTALEKRYAAEKAKSVRDQIVRDIAKHDYEAAKLSIAEMLVRNPKDPLALNLKAALEAETGDCKAAERTLDKAIELNPQDYHAYYNMAGVVLGTNPSGKDMARRYYETGRSVGGPKDAELEDALK